MRLFIALLSACAALYEGTGSTLDQRIFGGKLANLGDVPWQIYLKYYFNGMAKMCGGSIINDRWIITAGHCVAGFYSVHDYIVGVGILDYRELANKVNRKTINSVFIHPGRRGTFNDIALIKLNERIDLNWRVQAIRLPDADANFEGHTCIASGWGENDRDNMNKLLKVPLKIGSAAWCKRIWQTHYHAKTQICAGGSEPGTSACSGDSGGPLACRVNNVYYLAGVTSYGGLNCPDRLPDVFTRTSAFKTWINEIIRWNSYD